MKIINKLTTMAATAVIAGTMASPVMAAADRINIGYFLEWATPNMIAKAEMAYDEALGVPTAWTAFEAGTQMTEAMLAGDIDISYSQGLAPFINGVNANAPIKMVGLAVQYPANECIVRNGAGIDMSNASELEGRKVAVPLATMADFSFRMQMIALDVDVSKITVVDMVPADGAVALAEGNVDMVCLFGGNAVASAKEVGKQLFPEGEMEKKGIISFDVVSVREKFLQENPDMVKTFMTVTNDINAAYAKDQSKIGLIQKESGLKDNAATKKQLATMSFPTNAEQLEKYFGEDGIAAKAIKVVGDAFATKENPAKDDYSVVIDTSFLK